jgi:uncharacterized lipoprotein YddW (UPF0748 family)
MRGIWIATVNNIDWPSRSDLSTDQQKAKLVDLLDKAKALNLNAVFFQVRPATDALYQSELEPWSEYLTGQMGKAPEPFYDPLAFATAEAHRRGLELHAWFNPYRARMSGAKTPVSANHISKTRPELVKKYGTHLWLDPSEKAVQDYTTQVILDVVKRYDIDGVHFDDYFYPYKEKDADDKIIPFPDDISWDRYQKAGGKLNRDDWRRDSVNTLVSRLNTEIKAAKPWMKFGISPFGIWRPGYPAQIKGLDAYEELYADARKWLMEGWVDYLVPQLYWKIDATDQSFPVLLNWWTQQNPHGRSIWAGQYTDRAVAESPTQWPMEEIEYQIRVTRGQAGASGTVHFNAQSLLGKGESALAKRLAAGVYSEKALTPASPWISSTLPAKPEGVTVLPDGVLSWRTGSSAPVWKWVVQYRIGKDWNAAVLPGDETRFELPTKGKTPIDEVVVSAVDRLSNQSPLAKAELWLKPTSQS